MKVGIIDADLLRRKRHRFPNLACMKLSSWHKQQCDQVTLLPNYEDPELYNRIYVSKVFTDTSVPEEFLRYANVRYGGTGFYYDKAPKLSENIEHAFPDYHLYDNWAAERRAEGATAHELRFYTDYSVGFLTRGCFRQCAFCVNRNYKKVCGHSPLEEFYDPSRPKICLLDDNFLGWSNWREGLQALRALGKPFQFRQGLDERLLTKEKCELLFSSQYDGEYTFAFDNVADRELIESKLKLIREHTDRRIRFYCFCGFDRANKWNAAFWRQDLLDLCIRIEILMRYHALPYVMRFNRYQESPYVSLYNNIAAWCNQPACFKRSTLREFTLGRRSEIAKKQTAQAERDIPELTRFLDLRWR